MKKLILISMSVLLTFSCSANDVRINKNDIQKHKHEIIEYAKSFDILSGLVEFNNFKFVSESEQGYVYGEAKSSNGEDVVFRFTVILDGDYLILASGAGATGESCSGNNSSKCAFATNGGCECKKVGSLTGGSSYCNHSISRK
jgi:hypothetical protein